MLRMALDGLLSDVEVDDVVGIEFGTRVDRLAEIGFTAVSMSLIVEPEVGPRFCMVFARASDGRTASHASNGDP